jgi:hypothetical protein
MYVYGNAVPKQEVAPKRTPKKSPEPKAAARRKANRKKNAAGISPVYMAFLSGAAAVAVIICVGYLCLQADIANRSERVASLQEELADLNEQNTTAYNAAESSVNLEAVRERAIGEMGMVYVAEGNMVEYESPEEDSVVQFGDIPANGILVQK